ncbi:hypothetical protein FRC12_023201 [Ceratobasidium sp. 428]|nr:hypothetical protein FRC12_023201 [Ceratobasidium sp. 428]
MGAPGSSSGARRNTLTSSSVSSGPQAIEPVNLRDYPQYPNSGSTKHTDEGSYPPAFSAPVYGSRPQSPQTQTGNKARRSGGGSGSIAGRSAGTKRSVGGAGELKRSANERGRDSEKDEREMDREREEHAHRERERERDRERDREREREQERSRERREYDETARAVRERERQLQHEMDPRDVRRVSSTKRPAGLENDFARRQPSASDWDRPRERERERERDLREQRRVPREQERDWRREEEEARQGAPALVQSKHLPPISAHGGYAEKQPHMHSHSHSIPSLQQSRPHAHSHAHHYTHSHPRAASPPPLSHSALPPLLAPVWLGTYVFPNIPFPVRLPPALPRSNLSPDGYKPYQYTILVPTGFLPIQPPSRSPKPDIALWGSPITGYTDDSDILLAAVHSKKATWADIRDARKFKQDAKITVGVWVGGCARRGAVAE